VALLGRGFFRLSIYYGVPLRTDARTPTLGYPNDRDIHGPFTVAISTSMLHVVIFHPLAMDAN
jgi:hypothetical protein